MAPSLMPDILRFSPQATESDLRQAVIQCGRICYERHLFTANDGNISVRLPDHRFLITPSGISKGRMDPDDLLVIDSEGRVSDARADLQPSSETPMHLEAYRQLPEVRSVIHAHPVFATTLTVAGFEFPSDLLPEVVLTLGEVPTTAYATPSSDEDAQAIHDLILAHDAILLRQHGSLTVGKDLDEALIHLERIEHAAEVFWRAAMLGNLNRIPPAALENLRAKR